MLFGLIYFCYSSNNQPHVISRRTSSKNTSPSVPKADIFVSDYCELGTAHSIYLKISLICPSQWSYILCSKKKHQVHMLLKTHICVHTQMHTQCSLLGRGQVLLEFLHLRVSTSNSNLYLPGKQLFAWLLALCAVMLVTSLLKVFVS